jgi:serine/threonine-protein kinase
VVYQTPDPNDTNPPAQNTVLDQNPEPGPVTGPVSVITLIVEGAPGKVTVPNVVGMQDTDACKLLNKAPYFLTCQTQGAVTSDLPAGEVVKTQPAAGSQVDPHSTVLYWVSAGPATPTPSPTATATATSTATPTPTATP